MAALAETPSGRPICSAPTRASSPGTGWTPPTRSGTACGRSTCGPTCTPRGRSCPAWSSGASGYLLNTCSAAGLISRPGDAPYAVTKAAAIAFAEWVSIHYATKGVKVSVLCPQGVRTAMLERGVAEDHLTARAVGASGAILDPADVAGTVVEGLAAERFHIFPHPEVADFARRKADDPDRWLAGMARFVDSLS